MTKFVDDLFFPKENNNLIYIIYINLLIQYIPFKKHKPNKQSNSSTVTGNKQTLCISPVIQSFEWNNVCINIISITMLDFLRFSI